MRILALDYETGGLPTQSGDRETGGRADGQPGPVTLGVAVMDGEEVLDSREWIFAPHPRRRYEPEAERIHGYSVARMAAEGWPIASVMIDLRDFVGRNRALATRVVAFNSPFDLGFYSDCLFLGGSRESGGFRHAPAILGPWHCAAILAREMLPDLPRHRLDTVAAHFGLSRSGDKHGALEDAILAGRVYARLQALHEATRADIQAVRG